MLPVYEFDSTLFHTIAGSIPVCRTYLYHMKAILEFDLGDPDDAAMHARSLRATAAYNTLWDLDQWMRNSTKHVEPKDHPDAIAIREKLHEIMADRGVSFDDLP